MSLLLDALFIAYGTRKLRKFLHEHHRDDFELIVEEMFHFPICDALGVRKMATREFRQLVARLILLETNTTIGLIGRICHRGWLFDHLRPVNNLPSEIFSDQIRPRSVFVLSHANAQARIPTHTSWTGVEKPIAVGTRNDPCMCELQTISIAQLALQFLIRS